MSYIQLNDSRIAFINLDSTVPNINGMPILNFNTYDATPYISYNYSYAQYPEYTMTVKMGVLDDRILTHTFEFSGSAAELFSRLYRTNLPTYRTEQDITTAVTEFASYLQRHNLTYTPDYLGFYDMRDAIIGALNLNTHQVRLNVDSIRSARISSISIDNNQPSSIFGSDGGFYAVDLGNEFTNYYNTIGETITGTSRAVRTIQTNTPEPPKYVHQYNYKPTYIKHKLSDEENPLYLGAEIEVDKGGQDNHEVMGNCLSIMNSDEDNKEEKYIYGMHDGSLSQGFEIATMPATLSIHKALPYKKMFKYLTSQGYRAHDTQTCGLHIHINRDYFGETLLQQQISISCLTYLIETYWDEIKIIARRDSNRYSSRFNKKKEDTVLNMFSKVTNGSKYSTINLQHSDTIELRMFKGTLNYKTFINTLEFVTVIADVVKNTDVYNVEKITWSDIYDKFSDELKEYYDGRKNNRTTPVTSSEINNNEHRFFDTQEFYIQDTARCNRNNTILSEELLNIARGNYNTNDYTDLNDRIREGFRRIIDGVETASNSTSPTVLLRASSQSTDSTQEGFKQKIKQLKKDLKSAKRRNDYLATTTIQQELSSVQRSYNEYKRNKRNRQAA